jgi:hydroxyethylthiazole kinase-like uncharacterized protein yjeF
MPQSARALSPKALRSHPIPLPDATADKDVRGQVLIVGASHQTAGAVLLSAVASLRAGAGKLSVAVPKALALPLALRLPEARVIPLQESASGNIAAGAHQALASLASSVNALLVGPGMAREKGTARFAAALLHSFRGVPAVLDAGALRACREMGKQERGALVITPHAGEMADLMDMSKEEVLARSEAVARQAAQRWAISVALKGATTWLVDPALGVLSLEGKSPGLATSGSGDVLAGIAAGLLARGLPPGPAAAWAILAHHRAGRRLSRTRGPVGYLASELLDEIPAVIARFGRRHPAKP